MSAEWAITPREALAAVRVRAPLRGNRRLERLLDAANADEQLKAWWHVSAVNATRRLGMSDHSWVHIQIVLNIGLRLLRLLVRRGVVPSVVADYAMTEHDAEVVVAAGCLMHCVGMSIHRADHERAALELDVGETFDPIEVDDVGGRREPQLHGRQQGHAAGEQLRILELAHEVLRLPQAARAGSDGTR